MNDCKMNVVPSQSRPAPVNALDHVGHRDELTPSLERHHEMVAARATSAAVPPKYLDACLLACLHVCLPACLKHMFANLPACFLYPLSMNSGIRRPTDSCKSAEQALKAR